MRYEASADSTAVALLTKSLTGRLSCIIAEFRGQLFAVGNILADNAYWPDVSTDVRHILTDCVRSIEFGEPMTFELPADWICGVGTSTVVTLDDPRHMAQAGTLLSEMALRHLARIAEECEIKAWSVGVAARALQQGIAAWVEAGVTAATQHLRQRMAEAQADARHSMARMVHDELGNDLALALRQLELFELLNRGAHNAAAHAQLQAAKTALVGSMDKARGLVNGLRHQPRDASLEEALNLVVASAGPTAPTIEVQVTGNEEDVPPGVLDEMFLVVRECLRNCITHARATKASVDISITAKEISARVIDDGVGFDVDAARRAGANGLTSLTERVALLDGIAAISAIPTVGTRVTISIPLPERHRVR